MTDLRSIGASDQAARSALLGILYAEDFDDGPARSTPDPLPPIVEPSEPVFTQADIDTACGHAVAAARLLWEEEAAQRRATLLEMIAVSLEHARSAAETVALESADAIAQTILALVAGALPTFCRQHGPAEARAIIGEILPTLRSAPRVVVRAHPDLAHELRREMDDLQADLVGTLSIQAAPTLAPGDLKVDWESGSLIRDTRRILDAMDGVLRQLGLHQPREEALKRSIAHAE